MTAKRIILRAQADRDVEEAIDHYLTEAGSRIALGFVDALQRACDHLAHQPATGSLRYARDLDLPGLRSWPLERYPYLIFYVEHTDRVDVWRLLHAERDIPSWLQDMERD